MEYATEVWNPHLKNQIDRIEKLQKFFAKIMSKRYGYIYTPYDEKLKIYRLEKLTLRRKIADLSTTFKIIRGFTSLNVPKLFTFSHKLLRRPLLLRVRRHISKTQNNFFHRVVKYWNNLPIDAIQMNNPKKFRQHIRNIQPENQP